MPVGVPAIHSALSVESARTNAETLEALPFPRRTSTVGASISTVKKKSAGGFTMNQASKVTPRPNHNIEHESKVVPFIVFLSEVNLMLRCE